MIISILVVFALACIPMLDEVIQNIIHYPESKSARWWAKFKQTLSAILSWFLLRVSRSGAKG